MPTCFYVVIRGFHYELLYLSTANYYFSSYIKHSISSKLLASFNMRVNGWSYNWKFDFVYYKFFILQNYILSIANGCPSV